MRKVSTTVYLDAELLEELKELSRRLEIPMAAIVRRGIVLAMNEYEDEHNEREGHREEVPQVRGAVCRTAEVEPAG